MTPASKLLKSSPLFTFEPGTNNSRLWVVSDAENHLDHPPAHEADSGGPEGALPRRGSTTGTTHGSGGLDTPDHPTLDADEIERLAELARDPLFRTGVEA